MMETIVIVGLFVVMLAVGVKVQIGNINISINSNNKKN